MKRILSLASLLLSLAACNKTDNKGKFTVHGDIKNMPDQKVYLDQCFFSDKDPQALDSGELKNGKFSLSTTADEEGMYELRFEKNPNLYYFINDRTDIGFNTDAEKTNPEDVQFHTPANHLFTFFLSDVIDRKVQLHGLQFQIDSMKNISKSDSLREAVIVQANTVAADLKNIIIKTIDTSSDPVVAIWAVGYTKGIAPAEVRPYVSALAKRFPSNKAVVEVINSYNKLLSGEPAAPAPAGNSTGPNIGSLAPEISMTDTSGQIFSLSSLKGKYVLVDFWASWCGPCRGENPNVLANYNKYKDKNFTILGVSLDNDKAEWKKAILKDGLSWKEVSDLKGWNSAAATIYGFDAIPYNVLLDPSGKIIATGLTEEGLGAELEKVLGTKH